MRTDFELKTNVHENVEELRRYLGSATRPLSFAALADILNERDNRKRSASSVKRWEDGAEPDYASAKLMCEIAGVTFEEFALGAAAPEAAPIPVIERARDKVPVPIQEPPVRTSTGTGRTGR